MYKMPVMFLGHGSPMNIIEDNDYTKVLKHLAKKIPLPKAILVVSAHWETNGVWLTAMQNPRTIYDFGGFPKELYEINYPALGNLDLAMQIKKEISDIEINLDDNKWGFDHGTWSVLHHLFPLANIPVVQLSLDRTQPMSFHFELGKKLKFLRHQGVLILGSGNIVHNLRYVDWDRDAKAYEWCKDFDLWVKAKLESKNYEALVSEAMSLDVGKISNPTIEHYLPMLYAIGASDLDDNLSFEFEGFQNASISMRSFIFS